MRKLHIGLQAGGCDFGELVGKPAPAVTDTFQGSGSELICHLIAGATLPKPVSGSPFTRPT